MRHRWFLSLSALLAAASLSGCYGVNQSMDGMNNGSMGMNTGYNGGVYEGPMMPYPSSESVSWQARSAYHLALQSARANAGEAVYNDVMQARMPIEQVLGSYMTTGTGRLAGQYVGPGSYYRMTPSWPVGAPRNQPLVVNSVGGWTSSSPASFSFVSVMCSNASRTCMRLHVGMVSNGSEWLIRYARPE